MMSFVKCISQYPTRNETAQCTIFSLHNVMLIAFFDSCGLVYQHFVPPKTTVNKDYY